jgi:hypothetical protein
MKGVKDDGDVEDIAEFDYSKAPNLLDNPNSGKGDDRDKRKKRKVKPTKTGQYLSHIIRSIPILIVDPHATIKAL